MISQICKQRKWSLIILSFILVLSVFYYFKILRPQQEYYATNHVQINGVYLLNPIEMPNFSFVDTKGNRFTKDNLINHWTMMYFGFTHCELICPQAVAVFAQMYKELENFQMKKNLPNIVLVTIDPNRDSLDKMRKFLIRYNPQFIGLRGNLTETKTFQKECHVESTIIPSKKQAVENYSLNHTTDILLINPDGKIEAYFSYPKKSEQLARDYLAILKKHQKIA